MVTNTSIEELIKSQANSILGNISAELNDDRSIKKYTADSDILQQVLSNDKIKREIKSLEDYLNYYNIDGRANFHEITMVIRLGIRLGALYEIEDHKRNNYEYF